MPSPPVEAERSHVIEIFNANAGKGTLKKRLGATSSLILMAQEIGYHDWECEALSSWSLANGWTAIIVPGEKGLGRLASAGVAVFARQGIGLRGPVYPDDGRKARQSSSNNTIAFGSELVPHRAQHVVVDVPGWPSFNLFNLYLHTAEGMSARNAKILMNIGLAMAGQLAPSIIGGDWNMSAAEVEASTFPKQANVAIVQPADITCRTAKANTTIDYFAMTSAAIRLLKEVRVDRKWAIKPHRPVLVELTTLGDKLQYLTYTGGKKIDHVIVHGPMLPEPDWDAELCYAEASVDIATHGDVDAAWHFLGQAWAKFATKVGARLCHLTGSDAVQCDSYANTVRPRWVEYTYEGKDAEGIQSIADGWKWFQDGLSCIALLKSPGSGVDQTKLRDEIHGFQTSQYPGQGANHRLDATITHARRQLSSAATSAEDINLLLEEAEEDVQLAKQEADRDSSDRWKDWCDGASQNGAGRLHRVTSYKHVQAPTIVTGKQSEFSAHPHRIVEAMEEQYASLWKASAQAPVAWVPDRTALARSTPSQIRGASKSFTTRTSSSIDGLHPSHFQHLSDAALCVLGALWEASERIGLLPRQLTWMVMPMLPKAMGGHRLIILYSASYRVWQRARRHELDELKHAIERKYWGASSGRSAVDSAWLLAAKTEASAMQCRHTATVIADYSKYYETIPLEQARDKLVRLGAKTAQIKLVYNQWRGPRIIRLRTHHGGRPRHAVDGLPAGDGYADIVIKAHAVEEYDRYVTLFPLVRFSSYIDDTSLGLESGSKKMVIEMAVAAAEGFQLTAQRLGAKLNDKFAIIGSSQDITNEIVHRLGVDGKAGTRSTPYLGTDFAGGRSRGAPRTRGKYKQRLNRHSRRLKKLQKFRRAMPTKASERIGRIFRTGARPALTYGIEVNGVSDSELDRLRKEYHRHQKPYHGGVSASAKLVLLGDPAAREAFAPALQWCRMLWLAKVNPQVSIVPTAALLSWWKAAVSDVGVLAKWSQTRGPLQRAALSIQRAGWTAISGVVWKNHIGEDVRIDQITPPMLERLLGQGLARKHELRLGLKWFADPETRVSFDFLRAQARPKSRKYNAHQKFCINTCAVGGTWTKARAKEEGYITDGKCACGAVDTLAHRLADCMLPHIAEARQAAEVSPEFIQWIRDHPDDKKFLSGCFTFKDQDIPMLNTGAKACVVDALGRDTTSTPDTMVADALGTDVSFAEFAIDGSCSKPLLITLQRAGWAVTLLDPDTDVPLRTMYAPVPSTLPQTSAMAEYLAFAFTGQAADRRCWAYADFMGTVKAAAATIEKQLAVNSLYGGVMSFARDMDGYQYIEKVAHVKAHRSGDAYAQLTAEDRRLTDGNIVADRFAKAGAEMHDAVSAEFQEEMTVGQERAASLARLVAHILPLYPKDEERWSRATSGFKKVRSTRQHGWHQWVDTDMGQQCSQCLQLRRQGEHDELTGCRGTPTFLVDFLKAPMGHRLVAVNQKGDLTSVSGGTVFVCVGCGAWAQQRRKLKLRSACVAPTTKGAEVLQNLRQGVGPHRKLAKHIDATVQLKRLVREEAKPVRVTTSIQRADPEGPYTFEVRMAALHERIKHKERERSQALDERNTLLGQSHAASLAETMGGTSASTPPGRHDSLHRTPGHTR